MHGWGPVEECSTTVPWLHLCAAAPLQPCAQCVMLVYRLFGGSVNQGVPGQGGNMFDYAGPRGLKVRTPECTASGC